MKIEKINENQIRCTLTRADLEDRHLKISELAYGTEKAKSLFHDMMQQAAFEFGFEADDIPLMIEDTARKSLPDKLEGAEDFLQLLNKVKEAVAEMPGKLVRTESSVGTAIRLFSFGSLDRVLDAAHLLSPMYHGVNTLYKDPSDGFFVLALTQSSHTKSDFSKICNMLTEYGILEKSTPASLTHLRTVFLSIFYSFAFKKALIFSTNNSASMPCTMAASSRDSIWEAGHPRQCIPISIRIGATSGCVLTTSPIVVVFST